MEPEIVYEDNYCLVVNKPSDLLVHHSHFARNIEEDSLVELLKLMGYDSAVPVHRLDRKTSGLILFSKHRQYVPVFQELFESDAIVKTYRALLRGHLAESGVINSPVKNERGNYKEALTEFRCIEQFERDFVIPPYEKQRYSLVEFIPKTGRYHQLRIHANKMAHPIINDPKHGNRHHNHYFEKELGVSQLFLHSASLKFEHPFHKVPVFLEAELPDHWSKFFNT